MYEHLLLSQAKHLCTTKATPLLTDFLMNSWPDSVCAISCATLVGVERVFALSGSFSQIWAESAQAQVQRLKQSRELASIDCIRREWVPSAEIPIPLSKKLSDKLCKGHPCKMIALLYLQNEFS